MNPFLRGFARAAVETFAPPDPVVEIGSYQVAGQEDAVNLRPLFAGRPYTGVDFRPGPGVDVVADVEALPQPDGAAGTVLALSTFEHVAHFWRGFDEVYRVLRPDGVLVCSMPFYFHIHSHPHDYWRFTPEALKLLLARYPSKVIGWHGPRTRPANVWAVAFREGRPPMTREQRARFGAAMSAHAKMPLGLVRTLRYGAGRLLCGRRPFAPYLDREAWDCEWLGAA